MPGPTITSPKPPAGYKKSIYAAPLMHAADTGYTDADHDGESGRDLAAAAAATAADTYLSHLERTGRGRYGGAMPCFDPSAMRSDPTDNRKKSRTNCDYTLDEAGDTFVTELKDAHVDRVPAPPSTPLPAGTAAAGNELGRIKQEMPGKGYKSPTRGTAYTAAMGSHREQPTFSEQLYMDASNNCWESLIHLRQKILRHKQRLQQEQTTKYYYDSHSKGADGAPMGGNAFAADRYEAPDRINPLAYANELQHPYFDKMPSEPSSYASRSDAGYEKLMGEPSGAPPPPQPSSVPPSQQLPPDSIYGIMDYQQTDKLSNITRMMGANEAAASFASLSGYRKAPATETAAHSSSPLNESPSDCLSAAAYRDTMGGDASAVHPHMRKVAGFEKPMEKACAAGKGRDDEEFLKL